MSESELQDLARRQLADYDRGRPGGVFEQGADSLELDEAYRLQVAVAGLRRERGEVVAGYKIGCVSEAIRRQLGLHHPVFGHVFRHEIHLSGVRLKASSFDHLGIEGEFALSINRDVTDVDLLRHEPDQFVGAVFPVIELHHNVFRASAPSAVELVANNALHAGVVMPEATPALSAGETKEISVWLNGVMQDQALVDPLGTLPELATRLAAFGLQLQKGQIVLTGSPLPLYSVSPGDRITVRAPGIGEVAAVVE